MKKSYRTRCSLFGRKRNAFFFLLQELSKSARHCCVSRTSCKDLIRVKNRHVLSVVAVLHQSYYLVLLLQRQSRHSVLFVSVSFLSQSCVMQSCWMWCTLVITIGTFPYALRAVAAPWSPDQDIHLLIRMNTPKSLGFSPVHMSKMRTRTGTCEG